MMLAPSVDPMLPRPFVIERSKRETDDVFTFELSADGRGLEFQPGQFTMLYAFGVGEVPISISGDPNESRKLTHTIREVGAVSSALGRLRKGDYVGVRGPFGTPWPVAESRDHDLVIVAGGIGLAPLRPVIHEVLKRRKDYRRVSIVYGARSPNDLLFSKELERWSARRDLQFDVIVDQGDQNWRGPTGVVTRLLQRLYCRPERAVAMLCGPEVMMRFAARELVSQGYAPESLYLSTERNMKCAVCLCGRCQLGPHFICKDGPVFRYDKLRDLMMVREL